MSTWIRNGLALVALLWMSAPLKAQDTTLWLWHGAHDLRGLHEEVGERVAVAYLSRTLEIGAGSVLSIPRHDPIRLDPQTARTAVVHIELVPGTRADELAALESEVLAALEPVWAENAAAIQIDFDAPRSFRLTYAHLLHAIAARKPDGHALSMTAIGSWCLADRWLSEVPVDFIVPMLFGPGHEREMALAALTRGPLREPRCNEALGIREGDARPPHARRIYIFRQGGWTLERALSAWGRSRRASTHFRE